MSKRINLSESIVAALESIKQVLEVLYGYEINFCGDFQIDPQRINLSGDFETRTVSLTGEFRPRESRDAQRIYAAIDLIRDGAGWRASRACHLGIGDLGSIGHSWFTAHWGFYGDDINVVHIIEDKGSSQWKVGHGISDRHLEPLYPLCQ